ncbi:DUF4426 domain-containing protein [Pseudoalteromonas xiamenensis]|uniref:DUF4426 domain-containing protein n=2 Tax=Pseudoalteromonas xiamenensis TaxID=882626 RepID=A0A975DIK2_9GAMM|nr:DUF4426 domain-containing protein [Pseudoalteromonas xiamenensis]
MKALFRTLVLGLMVAIAPTVMAADGDAKGGQYKLLGDWQVHYIAFPSTFIQPAIAKAYGLTRDEKKAIINISVLKNREGTPAQHVQISGTAKNLIGNGPTLEFKEVVEGDAIYYLAQMDFYNEEIYRFDITIRQDNQEQTLKFQQKFYAQ